MKEYKKKVKVSEDWKLIKEESIYKSNPYETTIYRTFTLIHIPGDKVVKIFKGSEYTSSIGESDEGPTNVRFSKSGKSLIVSEGYIANAYQYKLKDLLDSHVL